MIRRAASGLLIGAVLAVAGCSAESGKPPPQSEAATSGRPIDVPSEDPGPAARTAAPTKGSTAAELPARVAIPELDIDLAILSGDATLPGNPPDYPLCGVAQYLTTYRHLGRDGATTWIYAHAREGMFLPLLEASLMRDGAALLGMEVEVDSTAHRRHRYRIVEVLRHALDRGVAADVPANDRRLVLQTSEGPNGTVPKLQVVAEFVGVVAVPSEEIGPVASPVACFKV